MFRLMYHFFWTPEYRHKVFEEPYRGTMETIICKAAYDHEIEVLEQEIPINHLHMVVRSEPKLALSDIMQIIKSISAREFFRKNSEIKGNTFGEESFGRRVIL